MAYLTESQLESFADSPELTKSAAQYNFSKAAAAQVTIFLSHSHKDRKMVNGLIKSLSKYGVTLYVDWNDSNMPRITNRETAANIKQQIADQRLFMVLATQNALASRWVPWEIGVADKTKGEGRMFIIPVADASGRYDGNEYLQLYKRTILSDEGLFAAFAPNETKGETVENMLKKAASVPRHLYTES